MKFKTLILTMQSDEAIEENAAKLRGFFATEFNNYVLLHQHNGNRFIYKYPLVQYKMIDNLPLILSAKEGVNVLENIYNKYQSIRLNSHIYEIMEKRINVREEKFGIQDKNSSYSFLTPWLALNEENHKKYIKFTNWQQRKEFLSKILIGNIISMSKGLGYTVSEPIRVDILKIKETSATLKGTPMLGFLGTFSVNFEIPDYFGLGKSVSRGFGTVRRIKMGENNV